MNNSQAESGFADGGINIYDIYADVCSPERASAEAKQFARVLGATRALTEGDSSQKSTAAPFQTMALAAKVSLPEPGDFGRHRSCKKRILDLLGATDATEHSRSCGLQA